MSESVIADERADLLRANLADYSTLRAVHNYVRIDTLTRLNSSVSYVEWSNKQSYKPNPLINRKYIGLPV